VRLQKFLAEAGVASRRAGEEFIRNGRVAVNGAIVAELGTRVFPARDRITVDGRVVTSQAKIYVVLHKPRGFVCSRADEEGRPIVGELLPKEWSHLYPVGRLDFNSEGLLLLTNDGDFSLRLTHPSHGVRKKYVVTLSGIVTPEILAQLTRGIFNDGERLRAQTARLLGTEGGKSQVELELTDGKNREVRRMFETLGMFVKRLVRTQIGPLKLGPLQPTEWRTLTPSEIRSLLVPTSAQAAPVAARGFPPRAANHSPGRPAAAAYAHRATPLSRPAPVHASATRPRPGAR
jgi:pseudouridine synthase